jgi:hypothetical protein
VLVIITPKETSSSLSPTILLPLLLPLYIVFQNWEESSWNRFLLETTSRDQIYHFIHPYFPYHFTLQLAFFPYLPYLFTIFFCIFQMFSLFDLPFFHIFHIIS